MGSILWFDPRREHSSVPTAKSHSRRAQGLSRLAASSRPPEGLGLDWPEHGGTLDRIGAGGCRNLDRDGARCHSRTGPMQLILSGTYSSELASGVLHVRERRRKNLSDWEDRHGADLNGQVPDRRHAPHRAEHACRGIIPSVAVVVHVRSPKGRRQARPDCSCVSVVGRRCLFAAAATAVRSIVPAAVRRRPDITLSVRPVGATRRAAAGAWPMRYGPVAGAPGKRM